MKNGETKTQFADIKIVTINFEEAQVLNKITRLQGEL